MEDAKTSPYKECKREEIVTELNKKRYHLINPDEITAAYYGDEPDDLEFDYSGSVFSTDYRTLINEMTWNNLEEADNPHEVARDVIEDIKEILSSVVEANLKATD